MSLILVVDDDEAIRDTLYELLSEHHLCQTAQSAEQALARLEVDSYDVVLTDISMPGLSGLEVLEAMQRDALPTRVLFVTATIDPAGAYDLVQAGAFGVLEKDATPDTIAEALLRIARGETVLAPSVQAALISGVQARREPAIALSPREHDVLRGLARGLTGPQIASELHVSPSTIKTHLGRLYERLGVSDRAAAVAEGMRRGLIE